MHKGHHVEKMTMQQQQTARMLYRNGWTMQRIADLFGVTRENIWKQLKRRGVPTRPRHVQRRDADGRRFVASSVDSSSKDERDGAGVIVTLREQRTRELYAMHVPGKRRDALRAVADWIDASDGDWRLLCYSTPDTILGDMTGLRADVTQGGRRTYGANGPEAMVLGTIGRIDLLDPEMIV